MAKNFREAFRWLLPSWLTKGEGGLVAYSLAVVKDIYLERVRQGTLARFVSRAQDDALAEHGQDRGIRQGRSTRGRYVERLQHWRYPRAHRIRGSAFAALHEVAAVLGEVWCRAIDSKGNEHTHAADGTETYAYGQRWVWDAVTSPTAALDADAGSDTGNLLISAPTTANLVLHCAGTPGQVVLVHLSYNNAFGATVAFPDAAWTRVLTHQRTDLGINIPYTEEVWCRRVDPNEDAFTTVTIACTANVAGQRFIGRAINVTGSAPFPANPVFSFGTTDANGTTLTVQPDIPAGSQALVIVFATSRVTTYAFSGGLELDELGTERTAGTTGIGIAHAAKPVDYRGPVVPLNTETVTIGTSFTALASYVVIVQQPQPKARFWIEARGIEDAAANTYSNVADDPLWTRTDGEETLGLVGMSPREASDVRGLFNVAPVWRPAGTRGEWLIVNLTGATVEAEPAWEHWSAPLFTGGTIVRTPTRDPAFRYVDLYAGRKYPGLTTKQLSDLVPRLQGGTYGGDPAGATWGAVTLPMSGEAYTGDPATFISAGVRLPDDGDQPT